MRLRNKVHLPFYYIKLDMSMWKKIGNDNCLKVWTLKQNLSQSLDFEG